MKIKKKVKIPLLKTIVSLYKKRGIKNPTEAAKQYIKGFKDSKKKSKFSQISGKLKPWLCAFII